MRCKFRTQASTATQYQASCLSYALTQYRKWFAKKTRMATLVVLLGLGGGFWVTTEANAPQTGQAQTARLDTSLVRQPDETYEDLLRRAEAAASAEAQASFDQGDGVTNVSITILAQNQGQIAPLLSLQVSQEQWRERPDAQRWATYFTNARVLLGFEDVAATTPNQPYTDTTDATPEQPQTDTSPDTGTEDIDGAGGQPGNTFTTPSSNSVSDDGSATPSSNPTSDGGSLLTPQPPAAAPVNAPPVTPQLSTPANNSTTETPRNAPQTPLEQPSTSDTSNDIDD